jgi:hypothetical protein
MEVTFAGGTGANTMAHMEIYIASLTFSSSVMHVEYKRWVAGGSRGILSYSL